MNKIIYDLTMNNWYLQRIEKDYTDTEDCYNFNKHNLKGFELDVFVDKTTNKPTRFELWATRFNCNGIRNNLDEVFTLGDYKQLSEQLSTFIKVFEKLLEEVKNILAPYGIEMVDRLTYGGDTSLYLEDIEEYLKEKDND